MSAEQFRTLMSTYIDVSALGAVDDLDQGGGSPTLDLTLVLHDATCTLHAWDLGEHVSGGEWLFCSPLNPKP